MKLYGDVSLFADKTGIRNPLQLKALQGNRKIAGFADKFIEDQKTAVKDEMEVSREGMEYIREQLHNLDNETDSAAEKNNARTQITQGKGTPSDKLYAAVIGLNSDTINDDGVSRNLYLKLNSAYLEEMKGKDSRDWDSHMEALAKAYASVRREITEGYEKGTRTVWIEDDSAGDDFEGIELETDGRTVRYRKLTREEEISMLDKAIDKFTENVAEEYVRNEESIIKEEAKQESWEAYKEENRDWIAFEKIVNNLVNEARTLLDRVREEIEKLEAMSQKEIDVEGRMEAESYNHRAETAARGKQQAQVEHYKKMSRMVSDVMTLRGEVRA